MVWQSTQFNPRASPPQAGPMRSNDGIPPTPPMHHHHRASHPQNPHVAPIYRPGGYGQHRHPPPPQPSRPYDQSRYFDHHRSSGYSPPLHFAPPPPRHYGEVSIEARVSPSRDGQQTVSPLTIDPFRTGGCTCKKSRCLKLYCQCFALSTTCGPKCKCQTCYNTPLHGEAIEEARKTILERNPSAFDDKFRGSPAPSPYRPTYTPLATYHTQYVPPPQPSPIQQPSPVQQQHQPYLVRKRVHPQSQQHPRVNKFGCKCKRSFCLKKYCECYQNSVFCGLNCRCTNCKNVPNDGGPPPHAPAAAIPSDIPQASSPRCVSEDTSSITTKLPEELVSSAESSKADSEDRMAIMAAVAMTELLGKPPRRVSIDGVKGSEMKRKADELAESPDKGLMNTKRVRPDEDTEGSPTRLLVESRNSSPVSYGTPQGYSRPNPHHRRLPPHHHPHHIRTHQFPYFSSPPQPRASPTYEDVVKSSGLPKSLSFRKICSKCGKTRGEHGELGFGNKCVFQECGKCGAGIQMHLKVGSPMGILCRLTVEEGATPGAAALYERRIRDLAARAEVQKTLLEDKRERAERLAQTFP